MLQQVIQNILVYVVMVTVLKGLIANEKFLEIFRFAGGMILIMLCLSPILSVFSGGDSWYQGLEENIFAGDQEQIEQEVNLAEGRFEEILLQECEEEIAQQFRQLARDEGEEPGSINVEMKKDKEDGIAVKKVSMSIVREAEAAMSQEEGTVVPVEKIVVDTGTDKDEAEKSGIQQNVPDDVKERQDAKTRKIKKKICDKYKLSGKAVIVWRENGAD